MDDLPFSKAKQVGPKRKREAKGLQTRTPLQAKARLRADPTPKEGTAVKGDVVVHRDPALLAFVRGRPCMGIGCAERGCDGLGVDPHHVYNRKGHRRGVDLVVPLSRICHDHYQQNPSSEPTWWPWAALALWEEHYERDLLSPALLASVQAL